MYCSYRHLYQSRLLRSKLWPVFGACTVELFEYLSKLMPICAQSGRVSGLEQKTDPASSARSSRKGLKDNINRWLGIVSKFCILFRTEFKISISGALDKDCKESDPQPSCEFPS